jgi:ElaB/YqjD/DUF883 family membrane-anchored ribosome-binding protein
MTQTMTEHAYQPAEKSDAAPSQAKRALDLMEDRGGALLTAAGDQLRQHWSVAKEDFRQAGQHALTSSRSVMDAADRYAQENPWKTAGIAASVGGLLVWLLSRR